MSDSTLEFCSIDSTMDAVRYSNWTTNDALDRPKCVVKDTGIWELKLNMFSCRRRPFQVSGPPDLNISFFDKKIERRDNGSKDNLCLVLVFD